jgi:hypothetical protein
MSSLADSVSESATLLATIPCISGVGASVECLVKVLLLLRAVLGRCSLRSLGVLEGVEELDNAAGGSGAEVSFELMLGLAAVGWSVGDLLERLTTLALALRFALACLKLTLSFEHFPLACKRVRLTAAL